MVPHVGGLCCKKLSEHRGWMWQQGALTHKPPMSLVEDAAGAGLEDNSSFMGGKF